MGEQKIKRQNDKLKVASVSAVKSTYLKRPSIKVVLFILVVLLLLLLGSSIAWKLTHKPAKVVLVRGPAVVSQVERLSSDQLNEVATAKTDPAKDVNPAYAKAAALSVQDKQQAAITEYKKIVAVRPAYYVYADYGLTLARAGDLPGAITATQQAIDALNKDSSMSASSKESKLRMLNNKLVGFKDEAGQ